MSNVNNNNNNEQKIQEIMSRYKQGNKERIDSIVEYTEMSIFLKENSASLTIAQKKQLHEQMQNYNQRNVTSGSRYEKSSNSKCDRSVIYADKTYFLADTNYFININIHPNIDGSGVTKLIDVYNPNTNERIPIEDLVYRFDTGEGIPDENLTDFQRICRNINSKYKCNFSEYIGFYHFNGKDLSFNPPGRVQPSGNTEVSSEGLVSTNSAGGVNGEKISSIKPIEENEYNQKYARAFNLILQRFNEAVTAYNEQWGESSIYSALAGGLRFWGPSIKDAKNAIKNLESGILTLKLDLELNDYTKFESDFMEIFGKSFDSDTIQNYNNDCAFYELVSQKNAIIESFKQYKKDWFTATYNTDISDETVDNLYNKLLGLLGGNEEELFKLIVQAEQTWWNDNKDNLQRSSLVDTNWGNVDNVRRCTYLKMIANDLISKLETDFYNTTGGSSFDEIKEKHQTLYEKAFGTTNDAFKTVEDFCEYQQIGTQIAKGVIMAGVLITVGVTSGGLAFVAVPVATLGTELVNSAIDEATKNKALDILNTKGPAAYLDHMIEDVHWGEICSQATTDACISVLFMGQAHVISNFCRIAGTAAGIGERAILGMTMGTQMAGDVALGSAIEYMATGEITIDGVIYVVIMDVVGNAIHIRDYHKKAVSSKPQSQDKIGFSQDKAPKVSKRCRSIETEIEVSSSSKQMQIIEQSIQNDKHLNPAEKKYLQQKYETRMAEVRQGEAIYNDLKQKLQEVSNPEEFDKLIIEFSTEIYKPDSSLSYKQRQELVDMASDKIDEFAKRGQINMSDVNSYYDELTPWSKAGAGMPKIVSECYASESVEKMTAYLVKKTSNPDLYYDAIGKITERILAGEVPSKTMLDELAIQIKKQVGGPISDIRNILLGALNKIDEMKCFVNAGYFDSKTISSSSPGYRRNIERFKSSLKNKTDVETAKIATEKVESKTEPKVEPKPNNTNEMSELFSEAEQKIIKQSATDTNPEILQKAINDIIELMKAGKLPDLEFIEALANKYRVRPSDLKNDLFYALRKLGSVNENYSHLRNACLTSNKNELPAKTIDGLNNFMNGKNIKFNDGVEKIKLPQKEAVEPVKTYDIRESAEYKQYSEKYPELNEVPFRDDNNLVKAGKAMEEYEQYLKDNEITYENFDETDLYQRLSDIENSTDAENVVNVMKNKYHSDVVAERNRIVNLKSKYLLDNEQIKISDEIIGKIKKMQANEEPYTIDDINAMIEDAQGYNELMNERVRNRILDEIKI